MTCLGVGDGGKVAGGSCVFSCVSINNEPLMTLHHNLDRNSSMSGLCHVNHSVKTRFTQQTDLQ